MASGLALAADAWISCLPTSPTGRTGMRILAAERYDVWLLKWPVGSSVSPHHHGDSDAAFVVVSGDLQETRWIEGEPVRRRLTDSEGAIVQRGVVHDVGALEVEALSVHVYSPPLATMAYFDDRAEQILLEEPIDLARDAFDITESNRAGQPSGIDLLLAQARARIAPRFEPWDLPAAMDQGALVVDTRPAALRERDGEIDGALVIERNVLEWRLDPTSPFRVREASDPERPVIIVCDEGYASSLAAATLLDLGRRNVTDLKGGYQAWKRVTQDAPLVV
jgi:rhodanese-related sulfurtransferase/mannose-6-phosphate isomerase-like protein (cupin superfamily)